jgi:tetratricopeptide (TPR) repeat protein
VTVKPPAIVQPAAVEQPEAPPKTTAVEPVPAPSAYLEDAPVEHTPINSLGALEIAHVVTPRRGTPPRSIVGIAVGTVLGLAAAATLSYRAVHSSASAPAARAAAPASTPAGAAAIKPREDASATPTLPAGNAAVEQPSALAAIPVSSSSVPSCRELLAGSFEEKLDRVGAFTQTELGKRELVRGKVEAAQRAFCQASLWDGKNVERWLNLSQIFLIRHDAAKALECAQAALALQPNGTRALNMAGDAWAMLGKVDSAREAYLAAEKTPEPDAKALKLMIQRDMEEANRTMNRRDFARAERVFRRVVVFDSQHAAASAGVANCLLKLGEMTLAEAWNRKAQTLGAR